MSNPPNKLLRRLNVPAPRHMAKKKSFLSAPSIVSGRESDRCTRLIRRASITRFSFGSCALQLPGNNHARKFTAAMAMPTPNSTPASTRFEPPSPKANVRPATTIATSERPRAMVLVNAVIRTLTAFSQGEAPCANAGAAKSSVKLKATRGERTRALRTYLRRNSFIVEILPILCEVSKRPSRGSPRWLRLEQGKRKAIEETRLYAPVPGLFPVQAHLERSLRVQRCPPIASVPLLRAARDAKRRPMESAAALSAGVTGENSPHLTNQPRKSKTDRVLVKYFFARACTCLKVAERAEEMIF